MTGAGLWAAGGQQQRREEDGRGAGRASPGFGRPPGPAERGAPPSPEDPGAVLLAKESSAEIVTSCVISQRRLRTGAPIRVSSVSPPRPSGSSLKFVVRIVRRLRL